MMAGKDGGAQIIEMASTVGALIALSLGLCFIFAALLDLFGGAVGASGALAHLRGDTFRPAHLSDGVKAFGIIDQVLNLEHG